MRTKSIDNVILYVLKYGGGTWPETANEAINELSGLQSENARLREAVAAARTLLIAHGFAGVLNGSNGKHYKRCKHCGGDNLSDKDELLPDNVKHRDGCELAAALAKLDGVR